MLKRRMDLQLFAEAGEGAGEAPDTNPAGADPNAKTGEKTYTEAELNARMDEVIKQKKAQWEKAQAKALSEAEKLAKMTEEEKTAHKISELEKRIASYEQAENIAKMTTTARGMLSEQGITISDELLSVIVAEDAEKTKEAVGSFAKMFKEAVRKAAVEAIKTGAPPKGSTNSITKEDILKIQNPRERQAKIRENIELFRGGNK